MNSFGVFTSVGQVSCFFGYHSGIQNEDSAIFYTSEVWVFDTICVPNTIRVYISCKNLQT
jgi:hypothetical protein